VERQLRQEAGFGCARCGHPYLEYHHIKPYAEEAHFRPEDMVAVCGNCHTFFETQGRDRQYDFKANPKNKKDGEFRGLLQYDKRDLVFRIGGVWYENTPILLAYRNQSLIACHLTGDQALVSINVFNSAERLVLKVEDSEVTFRLGEVWDFECKKNVATVRSGPRQIALKMDFSKSEATIEGKLWAGGKSVELGPDHSSIEGSVFGGRGLSVSESPVGIRLGGPGGGMAIGTNLRMPW
jgi:hypothetical protein